MWAAEHLTRRTQVAVKLMNAEVAASADAIRRFEGGVRAASALRSPNVVQILDYGLDTVPFLVMELLKGESLAQRLERRGALPWSDVWTVISQIAVRCPTPTQKASSTATSNPRTSFCRTDWPVAA